MPATLAPFAQAIVGRRGPRPGETLHLFFDGFTHPHYQAGFIAQTSGGGRLALPAASSPGQSRLLIPLSDAQITFATAHTRGAALAGNVIGLPYLARDATAKISGPGAYAVVILRYPPVSGAASDLAFATAARRLPRRARDIGVCRFHLVGPGEIPGLRQALRLDFEAGGRVIDNHPQSDWILLSYGGSCRYYCNAAGQRSDGLLSPGGRMYLPRGSSYTLSDAPGPYRPSLILLELAH